MQSYDDDFDDIAPDLREMLNRPLSDFPDEPLLWSGHYYAVCTEIVKGVSSQKKTPFRGFVVQLTDFTSDIPAEGRKLPEGKLLTDYEFPRRERLGSGLPTGQIWLTPNAIRMTRQFFAKVGFPLSKNFTECTREMQGRRLVVGIEKESYTRDDGELVEYNVMTTMQADTRTRAATTNPQHPQVFADIPFPEGDSLSQIDISEAQEAPV